MVKKINSVQELIELDQRGELIGIFEVSNEVYHAGPGVSKSKLDDINRSPLRFKHFQDMPRPSTHEMLIGEATDLYITNPEAFNERFATPEPPIEGPLTRNPWKKEWDEFKANNPGKIHIKSKDFAAVRSMHEAIKSHPVASRLICGQSQLSFYWRDTAHGVLCKCRPDFLPGNGICVDLKTTDNASYYSFRSKAHNLRYYVQDSFYLHGIKCAVEQAGITDFEVPDSFVFVVVERDAPHDIAAYQLDELSRELGFAHFNDNLVTYKECMESGIWPGYKQEIQTLHLPPWAYKDGADE
jgi:hypothetical protein